MNNKFKEKVNEIKRANNTVLEPKKNLTIEIVCGVVLAVVLGIAYCFFRSWEILVCAILVPPAMIGFCIHAYFKEKRHDKSSEKDKQEFLSGTKYRKKEWKTAYYDYKEKNSFEVISPKGMKYDLKRRYRTNRGFGIIAWGLLLYSIAAIFYPIKGWYIGHSILGIFFGGFFAAWSIYSFIGGPVIKFYKSGADISEIEKSYMKGRMLSFSKNGINNGINIGCRYTVIYNSDKVIAIENSTIQDMTRKMVRVKEYENSVYSGQEYRYFVTVFYSDQNGNDTFQDVRLDEFQCEMIITEFQRSFYPENEYENIASEQTLNSVSP